MEAGNDTLKGFVNRGGHGLIHERQFQLTHTERADVISIALCTFK